MLLASLAILLGFALLIWSADKFVDGAASTANHLGVPSLLIGILIVGFGTSAPEMLVSAIAALDGNPQLALGNGFGSNITNIALVLGTTALIAPILVHSKIVKKELPLGLGLVLLSGYMLLDGNMSFIDGVVLLGGFFALVGWSIYSALKEKKDALESEFDEELKEHLMPLKQGLFWLFVGIVILVLSSKILVWGAVEIAHAFGVSDLIIGLTIVALGTSLPELSASIVAVKKKEYDIAIGNVVGSNMFNILAVIGIATVIHPMTNLPSEILLRDWMVMFLLTITLFFMAYSFRGNESIISRKNGALLVGIYVAYSFYLFYSVAF
jgi:cation:H+ antiporter